MEDKMLRTVRLIADYQFCRGAGKALFPETCEFILSSTGRIRQIVDDGVRIATLKSDTGLLTLSIEGAIRLHRAFKYPAFRVCVSSNVSEFIAAGKSVFSKHVVDVWNEIRPGDEVIVVNEEDELLSTGRAVLSAIEMLEFMRGVAVETRQGILKVKSKS
ncbi:MAG: pseudouridine synthase [Archaeoglobus sp.]|jgi:uncharacterized protein with predicted RNA binding PUA domain|nr:MAG: pseudouridine synthase [Archaeoglobus sp.]